MNAEPTCPNCGAKLFRDAPRATRDDFLGPSGATARDAAAPVAPSASHPAIGSRTGPKGDADPTIDLSPETRPRSSAVPAVAGYEILGELGRGGMGVVY